MAPTFVALLLASVTLFTLVRVGVNSEKATFTVGDLVSRQTTVNDAFLAQLRQTFEHMVQGSDAGTGFRVTSVTKTNKKLSVDWSYAVSPMSALTTTTVPVAALPDIAEGDSLVLTETSVPYAPIFSSFGFLSGKHTNLSANRPRFTTTITRTKD